MSRSVNQKLKLLYLLDLLKKQSDEDHLVTMEEILRYLEQKGISAERKSIYDDFAALDHYGVSVYNKKGKNGGYCLETRDFEVAEVKLLVDAVQSSKFISEKKSQDLIRKLEGLTDDFHAKELQHSVIMRERAKSSNESVYYNVDAIQHAITNNERITFRYFDWNVKKEPELHRDGALYEVSPWALIWDDENYYLVAFDSMYREMRHYRVDKMKNVVSVDGPRDGEDSNKRFSSDHYAKRMFGMFGGESTHVRLLCENDLSGVMIDRFGHGIMMSPEDTEHFSVSVEVVPSRNFLSWVIQFGGRVEILSPDPVRQSMRELLKEVQKKYK